MISKILKIASALQFFNAFMDLYVWYAFQYLVPSWAMALEILGSGVLTLVLSKVVK